MEAYIPYPKEALVIQSISTAPAPTIPAEVMEFAAEHGAAEYFPAVLAMTRRIFADFPLTVLLEDDPEIANDWHIVFEVDVGKNDAQRLFDLHTLWVEELFEHCPSTHVYIFRLGMI